MNRKQEVLVLTGAGQLGMAIARRVGYGKKVFVADWRIENADATARTLCEAGFDATPFRTDISS